MRNLLVAAHGFLIGWLLGVAGVYAPDWRFFAVIVPSVAVMIAYGHLSRGAS